MDIIKEIQENVEKGEEVIENLAEEVENVLEKKKKKPVKTSKIADVIPKELLEEEKLIEEAEAESVDKKKVRALEDLKINSLDSAKNILLEERKKILLEKAKKLKEKVSGKMVSSEELKEQVKIKKREDMLIPLEDYVKSGIYLGTKVVTPDMKPYVYRRRADGLAIFNTDLIDEKIKEAIEFLSRYNPEDIIVVCKRPAGWRVVEKFSELTGIRVFTKKYPAGILTNTNLENFFENELTIVNDSWLDKNALNDTLNIKKKVLMVCDTNNFGHGADKIIIGNNKSAKSLGVIYYLLSVGYCKAKGIKKEIPDLDWWISEEDNLKAEFGV